MDDDKSYFSSCLTILFHVLSTLVGLTALGIGVYVYWNSSTYSSGLNNCSIPLIAIGIVVSCLHTCGFWVIHKNKNNYFSVIFVIILLLLALGLVIMAALTYFVKNETLEVLSETIENKFQSAEKENSTDMDFVNTLQKYGHCCGSEGPSFWGSNIPESCCNEYNINSSVCSPEVAHPEGCKNKAVKLFAFFIFLIIISVLILAASEVISAVLVIWHCTKRRRRRKRRFEIVYSRCSIPIID